MKHLFSIAVCLYLFSFSDAQTPDEYGSFTIAYPWSSEFQFRIYDVNGAMMLPENLENGSLEMHSVLPKNKGEHSLQFDISSGYFIYSQESDTEIYTGWVFVMGTDTMSISIPNYPAIMSIDSIPFAKGQFFISEDEFNEINLQSRNYLYSDYQKIEFNINGNVLKKLDFSDMESLRFNQDNYDEKKYPNDADMYEFDGYYKSNSFFILTHLKDSLNTNTKLACEVITLPFPIYFDVIAAEQFTDFNTHPSFIIDNENDLKKALGNNKLNIDVDFSKEIILQTMVGGDCNMKLRHQVIMDENNKTITWKIYNFWGGCRAGGRKSAWIKILKPEDGFRVETEVVLVD